MRKFIIVPAVLAALATLPSGAAVEGFYHGSQFTIAQIYQNVEGATHEVGMMAGRASTYASTELEPGEFAGACVSISHVISRYDPEVPGSASEVWIDEGCSEDLEVTVVPALGGMAVRGTLESSLYYHSYDGVDFVLDFVRPSTIEVDLLLVGEGDYRYAFSERWVTARFCGLPWDGDFRGGGAGVEPGYERDAGVSGSLASASTEVGAVDTGTLGAEMAEFLSALAGACVTAL